MEPFLHLQGIRHYYNGRQVLDIPDLRIEKGSITGLAGPNGSGKSTLLRILALAEQCTAGTILLEGADWNDGLDMAQHQGESVAFSALYAGNLQQVAELVLALAEMGAHEVDLAVELLPLLDTLASAGVTVIVGIPLAINSVVIGTTTLTHYEVSDVATTWSSDSGWEVVSVEPVPGSLVVVRVVGPEPSPDPQELRRMLDESGLADVDVRLELVPETEIVLPAGG